MTATLDQQRTQPEEPTGHPKRGGLFVTDQELIEKWGVPVKIARLAIQSFDANPASGFPQKQPLMGHRRYWPAVKDFLDIKYGLKIHASRDNRRAS